MYISKSKSYRQISLTVLKVICVIAIFVGPIALIQVIAASKQAHTTLERLQDDAYDRIVDSQAAESMFSSAETNPGQLGELFDVSQRKDGRDSKSILRLKRQTDDDDQRPSLAQLTAAGTAAGMMLGDQLAAAQIESDENESPKQAAVDEDNESDAYEPPVHNLDLSSLQSLKQQVPQSIPALNQVDLEQQQQQQQSDSDNFNPEQMPDSTESLMRSEQEDMGADDGDNEQTNEQPSARNQVVDGQVAIQEGDNNDIEQNDSNNQNSLLAVQNLPTSFPPVQGQTSDIVQGAPEGFNGAILPGALSSPIMYSSEDLKAAAGHHYKKKKKKKVKKIIIKKKKKKSKKYKKVKKVKIIKYKKKSIKKKKPKKHHHHHHHDHGKYYMYAKVPKKKSWEFGFKKGNKKHWIERHEKGYKNKFKTKVKWFDKKSKGKGVHIWDYNHHDKKKKKHH